MSAAQSREKEIKHWTRQRVELIESTNPMWEDLAASWFSQELLANPNAPAVIKCDPEKIQSAGSGRSPYNFKKPTSVQSVRINFRPSQVRTFGGSKSDGQV